MPCDLCETTSASQCSEAYKIIVVGGGEHMSQHEIFTIRNRCVLQLAYIYAMERLGNSTMNFTRDCCGDAVLQCNNLGIVTTVSKRTLSAWNKQFSLNKGKSPDPNPSYLNRKGRTPPLFEYFDESPVDCKQVIYTNVDNFSVEMLRSKLVSHIIPKYYNKARDIEVEGTGPFIIV